MPTLYKRRIEQGLCGGCGKPNKESSSLCNACKEKSKQRAAASREKRKAGGKCIQCGKRKPRPGSSRCRICLASHREARADRTAEFREEGLCVGCGQVPPKADCVLCQACITKRSKVSSEHYRRRKEAGTCLFCSRKPAGGKSLCRYHQERYRDYRFQAKLEVLEAYGGPVCAGCGGDNIETLEIDHIGGGGRKHLREENLSGGYQFYLWLRKNGFPPGYRVLCPTCNKKAHAGIALPNET